MKRDESIKNNVIGTYKKHMLLYGAQRFYEERIKQLIREISKNVS